MRAAASRFFPAPFPAFPLPVRAHPRRAAPLSVPAAFAFPLQFLCPQVLQKEARFLLYVNEKQNARAIGQAVRPVLL